MPPTYRDGLVFIDDSQGFESLEQLVSEFQEWGEAFYPFPVGFQCGYPRDKSCGGDGRSAAGDRKGHPGCGAEYNGVELGGLHSV